MRRRSSAGAARGLRDRLRADALVAGGRLRARLGVAGARGGGAAAARREGERRRDVPRRARDEGRRGRGPACPRASRRLRPAVRGRPLPRPSHPARGEESVRVDERDRRLRDDRDGARRRPRPVGDLRPHDCRRGRRRRHLRPRGDAAAAARDSGARRPDRSRDAAPRGHRRRPEAPRDDRGRALPARRHPARRRPTCSSTSPGASASTSPAPTSGSHSPSPRPRGARRCSKGSAAFGEIGLTGRLRPAAQADRRAEECRKFGCAPVLGRRRIEAETLRRALASALADNAA